MPGNANFDTLLATTMLKYKKRLTDNVFLDRPLTNWMMSKGRMRMEDGGTKIVEPLIYASNDTVAAYSDYDTIALTPQEGISAAEFEWRQLAGSIAISGIEEAKNNGESAVLKLLDAKVMQLEESMKDKFTSMFFAASVATGEWNSLNTLVDATGTVGNINGATDTWWASYEENTATALTLPQMTVAYNTIANGNDVPDGVFTTQTLYEKYESLLSPQLRYTDTKMADVGFQNLMFKTAPVTFDKSATAGCMYFLNSKYIQLVGHSDKWFHQTPFQSPENMDARYALILCYGNLTIRNRKRLGKLTAKTG
jgi:hypothetical protein